MHSSTQPDPPSATSPWRRSRAGLGGAVAAGTAAARVVAMEDFHPRNDEVGALRPAPPRCGDPPTPSGREPGAGPAAGGGGAAGALRCPGVSERSDAFGG